MSQLPLGLLRGEAEGGRNHFQPGFWILEAGQPEELSLLVPFPRRPGAWEASGVVALMRHPSSSLLGVQGVCVCVQYDLKRSLKLVMEEEVDVSARICFVGQSAGLGPLPVLLTMSEGHGERILIFLADVPLDGDLVTGCGLPESHPPPH